MKALQVGLVSCPLFLHILQPLLGDVWAFILVATVVDRAAGGRACMPYKTAIFCECAYLVVRGLGLSTLPASVDLHCAKPILCSEVFEVLEKLLEGLRGSNSAVWGRNAHTERNRDIYAGYRRTLKSY
jgi:hypothetical protein